MRTPRSSPTPLPRRGTSSLTATWDRTSASSGRSCRRRRSGKTPSRRRAARPLGASEIAELKSELLKEANGLSISELVKTAWASAASYRGTDHRGGANGARVRLEPQKQWAANDPPALAAALEKLEKVRSAFNAKGGAQASLADVIVLGGCAAIESAAKSGGNEVAVPFSPGAHRCDAGADRRRVVCGARADRRRLPQLPRRRGQALALSRWARRPRPLLVDKAHMLTLTKAEMTVLVAGLSRPRRQHRRCRRGGSSPPRRASSPNDFFVNLLDMGVVWSKKDGGAATTCTRARAARMARSSGRRRGVDLVFGSNSQLRALAEHYACDDAKANLRGRLCGGVGQSDGPRSL